MMVVGVEVAPYDHIVKVFRQLNVYVVEAQSKVPNQHLSTNLYGHQTTLEITNN